MIYSFIKFSISSAERFNSRSKISRACSPGVGCGLMIRVSAPVKVRKISCYNGISTRR